jgi:trigger factor
MSEEKKAIDFKSTVIERKSVSIIMEVEVAADIVKNEFEKALVSIQKQVLIAGFRQGKAPISIVREKYANEAKDRAIENVIKATVFQALDKEKFNPLDIPVIDELDYEIGKDLKYHFNAQCHPDYKVKDYKEIPIKKEIYKITEASLIESIDKIRESNAFLILSQSNIVSAKSSVLVDYEAFDDKGVKIAGIEAKNFLLDLSSERTLKEFKAALVGAKAQDEKDIKISYPQDYPNKELAGKTAIFKTKILEIKEKQIPELNDDFAKDMGSADIADFKKKVQSIIEEEEKRRQDMAVESQITDYLLKNNVFDIADSLVLSQEAKIIERMKKHLQSHGESEESINKQVLTSKDKIKEEAQRTVKLSYILNMICAEEKLDITESDLQEEKNKMLAANADRQEEVEKYFNEKKDDIELSLKESKLFKFIIDNAKIAEEIKDMPLKAAKGE